MLNLADKERIRALLKQIYEVHTEARKRPSGHICDICGQGDFKTERALFKVKNVVNGYAHRPHASPTLCFRHAGGWAHSFYSYSPTGVRTDEEVDLHFALYLAKQLKKEKANA